ncbi:MAG: hypothetical protein K6E10_07810 [Eubacterium sp.]|nr:hypothetical protein [Eubacterium sp.]
MESREEKLLSFISIILMAIIAMPVVGVYMICKKNSNTVSKIIGIIMLVFGVVLMVKRGYI